MSVKRNALGKGLTALLQNKETDITAKNPVALNSIAEINISEIEANPFQPRLEFDEAALDELSESIKLHGVIQPVTVRKVGYGKYELIAGERRTRASIRAGLKTIPAYIRVADDQGMLEMALIENLHRENLNPIEISLSYKRLLDECNLKQEELADRVGKNRSTVTNYLRLLKLPEEIQVALRDGQITLGHARPLIVVEDTELQIKILEEIIDQDLSVRKVEELIRKLTVKPDGGKAGTKGKAKPTQNTFAELEASLAEKLGSTLSLKVNKKGKGKLIIFLNNKEDLTRISERFSEK